MKKLTIVTALFLTLLCTTAYAADKSKLEWGKMPGVARYDVEVRNTMTGSIKRYTTTEDHIWADIGFGFYEMRVTAFNKAGKEVTATRWIPLTIMKTYQPEVNKLLVKPNGSNIVQGDNYYQQTKVSISKNGSPLNVRMTGGQYPKEVTFAAPLQKNTKYSLLVENPGDYRAKRIAHVFNDSSTMLFNNEDEYTRYFSDFFAQASINYQILMNSYWKDVYEAGLNSGTISVGYHFFSWFGATLQTDFSRYTTTNTAEGDLDITNNYITLHPGIFFSYKNKDYIPYIFGSAGVSYSWLDVKTPINNIEKSSTDLVYSGGAGCKYFVYKSIFTDLSLSYSSVRLEGKTMDSVSIRLGFGSYFKIRLFP